MKNINTNLIRININNQQIDTSTNQQISKSTNQSPHNSQLSTLNSQLYLSTAYLAPIQYYSKLAKFDEIFIEIEENYQKQTYRNRCHIAGANGIQALSVPIEKSDTLKTLTRDIKISDHGHWQHLHWNALVSAYNMSPFFEYYEDDFAPFYEKRYNYLLDFNEALQSIICDLIDIHPKIRHTKQYEQTVPNDFRNAIDPRHPQPDDSFQPKKYYQVFQNKYGFLPNISIIDLLFNMGPEAILFL